VIENELEDFNIVFHIFNNFSTWKHELLFIIVHVSFFMQYGSTPAYVASQNGHTETVALLLANKADINSADSVQQFKYSNVYK
jgi:ankyrin repeat protein